MIAKANRVHLESWELDVVAQCPFAGIQAGTKNINNPTSCPHCVASTILGTFMMQKIIQTDLAPTTKVLVNKYIKAFEVQHGVMSKRQMAHIFNINSIAGEFLRNPGIVAIHPKIQENFGKFSVCARPAGVVLLQANTYYTVHFMCEHHMSQHRVGPSAGLEKIWMEEQFDKKDIENPSFGQAIYSFTGDTAQASYFKTTTSAKALKPSIQACVDTISTDELKFIQKNKTLQQYIDSDAYAESLSNNIGFGRFCAQCNHCTESFSSVRLPNANLEI